MSGRNRRNPWFRPEPAYVSYANLYLDPSPEADWVDSYMRRVFESARIEEGLYRVMDREFRQRLEALHRTSFGLGPAAFEAAFRDADRPVDLDKLISTTYAGRYEQSSAASSAVYASIHDPSPGPRRS